MNLTEKVKDFEKRIRDLENQNEVNKWIINKQKEEMWNIVSHYRGDSMPTKKTDLYNALGLLCGFVYQDNKKK